MQVEKVLIGIVMCLRESFCKIFPDQIDSKINDLGDLCLNCKDASQIINTKPLVEYE
jgi:hypothetical protein